MVYVYRESEYEEGACIQIVLTVSVPVVVSCAEHVTDTYTRGTPAQHRRIRHQLSHHHCLYYNCDCSVPGCIYRLCFFVEERRLIVSPTYCCSKYFALFDPYMVCMYVPYLATIIPGLWHSTSTGPSVGRYVRVTSEYGRQVSFAVHIYTVRDFLGNMSCYTSSLAS